MADKPVAHIGENSPEKVAFDLMEKIAGAEHIVFYANPQGGYKAADRKWILDTYAECLHAVRGFRSFPDDPK